MSNPITVEIDGQQMTLARDEAEYLCRTLANALQFVDQVGYPGSQHMTDRKANLQFNRQADRETVTDC